MTVDELLGQLEAVRARGSGKWQARCPAHEDRHPSLSIREGERGLLVKCWAGCTLEELTRALGLKVRELFYDTNPDPRALREAQRQRERKRQRDTRDKRVDGFACDTLREAEKLIRHARGLDISAWSPTRLDRELNRLADVYDLLPDDYDGH